LIGFRFDRFFGNLERRFTVITNLNRLEALTLKKKKDKIVGVISQCIARIPNWCFIARS